MAAALRHCSHQSSAAPFLRFVSARGRYSLWKIMRQTKSSRTRRMAEGRNVDSASETRYSPYLAARRDWDERYGSLITRARNWRVAALLALLVAVLEGSVLIRVSLTSKLKTIVVAVD